MILLSPPPPFTYLQDNSRILNLTNHRFSMAEEAAQTKKITLRDFKSDEFKVWEVSTKATLKLHKLLRIVDGTDPDPTPRNPDGTARAIPPALRARVSKWENDHER